MIETYLQMILAGQRPVNTVPGLYRQQVIDAIEQRYADGEITEETYNQIQW